jgi:hypothetical protein
MEKSESIKELATALCKFQGAVEKIKKSELNPFFKSKYADLSSILDVIRTPLSENGLSFVQFPKAEYELETMLMHTSGEWMSETYKMTPVKNDPQGMGSVITYQRRYALGAILGLNIDIDDDGNKGSDSGNKGAANKEVKDTRKTLTPEMITEWGNVVKALATGYKLTEIEKKWKISDEHKKQLAV